jgi:hypothetical protein
MYSVGMRIPTGTGSFVSGSHLASRRQQKRQRMNLRLLENDLAVLVRVHAIDVNPREVTTC